MDGKGRWLRGALWALGCGTAYGCTPLGRAFGDGIDLGLAVAAGGGSHHWLLGVLARALVGLGLDGESAVHLLSLVPMALGVGWIAFAAGWQAAALLASAPAVWLFATTPEVHGLQLLGAAMAVCLMGPLAALTAWRRAALVLALAALLPLFHPVLVGLWPLLGIAALPTGLWRRGLTALLFAFGPALALLAAPLARRMEPVAYLETRSNIGDLAKALPGRIRDFGAPSPRDYLEYLWVDWIAPYPALVCLGVAGWLVALCRGHGLAAPALATLLTHWVVLGLMGIREMGGYPIGAAVVLALGWGVGFPSTGALGRGRPAALAIALLAVLQWGVGRELRAGYAAEGEDRAFAAELVRELKARGVDPSGAWLLCVRNTRWRAVQLAGGPSGVDVRFVLDAVPGRSRAAASARMLETARGYVQSGGVLLVDPTLEQLGARPRPAWLALDGLTSVESFARDLDGAFGREPFGVASRLVLR